MYLKSLPFLFFLFVSTTLLGQSHWASSNSFTADNRTGAVGFSINGYGYVGSGFPNFSPAQKDFYKYDPATDSWTAISDYAGSAFYYGFAAVVNNLAYAGLGGNSDWYQYNPTTDTWTAKTPCPQSLLSSAGFVIGTNIYVGTGNPFSITNAFWMYNTLTDTWTEKANFGGIARYAAVGFAINGKGYIGLGTDGNVQQSDLWEYDPSADAWTTKASYPNGGKYYATGFAIGNKGYCGMGLNQSNSETKDFYAFDPAANAWTAMEDCPTTQYETAHFVIDGVGYTGIWNGYNTLYSFTPSNTVTATQSSLSSDAYRVFPNPTAEQLYIESPSSNDKGILQLFNAQGEQVLYKTYEPNISLQQLDVSTFPKGMYELLLMNGISGVVAFREKIMIQ